MRTTVLLPDELYAQVRRLAQTEDVTVTSVIERSLRAELLRVQREKPARRYAVRPLTGGRLRRGVDLDDNADLLDRMERS